MFFPVRTIKFLKFFFLVFVLLTLPCGVLCAAEQEEPSIEIFVDEALRDQGIMPQGITWNRPLKAGDMALPRYAPRRKTRDFVRSKRSVSSVGELKAPRLSNAKRAIPPLVATKESSTASVMLLQGMKSALQKAGFNSDIPKSSIEPQEAKKAKTEGPISLLVSNGDATKEEELDILRSFIKADEKVAKDGVLYEEGQEPRNLAAGQKIKASEMKALSAGEVSETLEEEISIFGKPVAEASTVSGEDCVPQVTKWTRTCSEAGYPAQFVGNILGETRISCPSGKTRDVWLSNSCTEAVGQIEDGAQAVINNNRSATVSRDATLDASCGTANGLAASVQPSANLCVRGEVTPVTGEGPWRWNCMGRNGGVTVSCAAPFVAGQSDSASSEEDKFDPSRVPVIQDGQCGSSHGVGVSEKPTQDLCKKGSPSRVSGQGPWNWACSGLNGGAAKACVAPKKVGGACGKASRDGVGMMPTKELCEAGYASAVTGEGPWNWTCSGLYGGGAATCKALPKVNAICGRSSMVGHKVAPDSLLCSVGKASDISGNGPWTWECSGALGGAEVSCEAPVLQDGKCGNANGNQYLEMPDEGLCEQGTSSRVTGLGPWNWTCIGNAGGASEGCTASLGNEKTVEDVVRCGAAAQMLALFKPMDKFCEMGVASAVSGDGPWRWSCSDNAGHNVACTTMVAAEGVCGSSTGVPSTYAPVARLCESGAASKIVANQEDYAWEWTCESALNEGTVTCSAPMSEVAKEKVEEKIESGQCGMANGQGFTEKPEDGLCERGTASDLQGEGPWNWSCEGEKGAKVLCGALKLIDGACGQANGAVKKTIPQEDLCASGETTRVSGTGPWMWSCVGIGGGMSTSCSAASQARARVDGTCGAAANALVTSAPKVNLCDTGESSAVHGKGPWTWTCSGMNGGIASTCMSSKVMPKAPLPPGPRVNGLCGYANGRVSRTAPKEGLCSAGTLSAMSGNGPWNWSCLGQNSGMTVSCTAPLMPPQPIVGVCGTASGVPTLTAPRGSLCSSGITSAVSGKGPWTWSCSGTSGGGAVSCVAPRAGGSSRGVPSLVTPSVSTPALTPMVKGSSSKSLVTPQLPTGALPALKAGELPNLKLSKPKGLLNEPIIIPNTQMGVPAQKAPRYAPALPRDERPIQKPKVSQKEKSQKKKVTRDSVEGVETPLLDSKGKPVFGGRLNLSSDVSMISFDKGSDALDRSAVASLEKLAEILKIYKNPRITLVAYSSVDGFIAPRKARRISLDRALAIRDFLSDRGISSTRIDMKPMGGNVPSGDMDRVDIRVN